MKETGPKKWILKAGELMEVLISVILVVAIVLLAVRLVYRMIGTPASDWNMGFWSTILQNCFNLVIGIEFVRMLLKHSAGSVVEIVLFTVARGMVAEHQNGLETLLLVASLAGVFAIRKFLLLPGDGEEDLTESARSPWTRRKRGGTRTDGTPAGDAAADDAASDVPRGDAPAEDVPPDEAADKE